MTTKVLSYDALENVLGRPDREEASTNRRELLAIKAALRRALEQELTHRQLECVRLYYYQRMTEEETAAALGISRSTVCRHLQKARDRLRRAAEYGGEAYRVLAKTAEE